MKRIAIVGAGVSGLTCAWYLQKYLPDAFIQVFEASDRVGGVIQTESHAPYLAELGADNVATFIPEVEEFLRELGISESFVPPNAENRFAQVVRQGKLVPIPNGFSLMQPTQIRDLLTSPVLSISGKLRVLGEYFVRSRSGDADESVESFAVRRLGRECFDRLVEPIIGGIFTARAETLSMRATMRQFLAMEREHGGLIRAALAKQKSRSQLDEAARRATGARYDQFLGPKEGMSWWMSQIERQLRSPVRLLTSVQDLVRGHFEEASESSPSGSSSDTAIHGVENSGVADGEGWSLRLAETSVGANSQTWVASESAKSSSEHFDALCLALPSWKSADLLEKPVPSVSRLLDRVPYASSAIAILAVPKSELRRNAHCFGVVVPKIESRDCLAISLTSEKYSGRSPKDTVLLRIFMGGMIRPELLDYDDEKLLYIARQEAKTLLGIQSLPDWQKLVRWNQAMPQYLIGHCEKVAAVRTELANYPDLHLIGNAYEGVGVPQCIRLAKQTAASIAERFQR